MPSRLIDVGPEDGSREPFLVERSHCTGQQHLSASFETTAEPGIKWEVKIHDAQLDFISDPYGQVGGGHLILEWLVIEGLVAIYWSAFGGQEDYRILVRGRGRNHDFYKFEPDYPPLENTRVKCIVLGVLDKPKESAPLTISLVARQVDGEDFYERIGILNVHVPRVNWRRWDRKSITLR